MDTPRTFVLGVVGGASGVGKTTLLDSIASIDRINTGDLFKQHMAITDRDEIRSTDWSKFEKPVADDLISVAMEKARTRRGLVIDTHFAAKLNGTEYRIGLSRGCLYRIATEVLLAAAMLQVRVLTSIVLVYSSPYDLLARRRMDPSRKRELAPADCIKALSRNNTCSTQYLFEFARAYKASDLSGREFVIMKRIENSNQDQATSEMKLTFEEALS